MPPLHGHPPLPIRSLARRCISYGDKFQLGATRGSILPIPMPTMPGRACPTFISARAKLPGWPSSFARPRRQRFPTSRARVPTPPAAANCFIQRMQPVSSRRCGSRCRPTQPHERLAVRHGAGCLADNPAVAGQAPDFRLSNEDRKSLQAYLRLGVASVLHEPPAEASQRLVARLRCTACHSRDGHSSRVAEVLDVDGTQGLPPEQLPPLTWTGEKLRSDWTERQLAGKLSYRSRAPG